MRSRGCSAAEPGRALPDPLLDHLCRQVSVSGNEAPVAEILAEELDRFGDLEFTRWGDLICKRKGNRGGRRRAVLTAHMDSPGFVVQQIGDNGLLTLIPMGSIRAAHGHLRPVRLRTTRGILPGLLELADDCEETQASYRGHFGFVDGDGARAAGVRKGDGAAWATEPFQTGGLYAAPHLDNRIGCTVLVRTAGELARRKLTSDVFFLATTCEETRAQRGAHLLADLISPDLAVVLDTTYEAQDVRLGSGPVLTLYDDAVQLPMRIRDRILALAHAAGIPLQTEVYNYAGTDARSLAPSGRRGCITLPLLVATRFNHTPVEICDPRDLVQATTLAAELIRRADEILDDA